MSINDYRRAVGALGQAVGNDFRLPEQDSFTNGETSTVWVMDPHELRTAVAAVASLLGSAHGIAAGIAKQARSVARDEENAGVWSAAEKVDPRDLAESGDPTEFRRREVPQTEQEILTGRIEASGESIEQLALWLAAQLGEALPTAEELLTDLRSVTDSVPFDVESGEEVYKHSGETGWFTHRTIVDPETSRTRVESHREIPNENVRWRPRPVEVRGTELDEVDREDFTPYLDLTSPLPDPAEHGWVLEPERTHPRGATRPTHEDGLARSWRTPDGKHNLHLYYASETRLSWAHYDNHSLPKIFDLLVLTITEGAKKK
jgi:hypothetical protein